MDTATAAEIRTYAKNAATAFAGQANKLGHNATERPGDIDVVMDLQAFMDTRALWVLYQQATAVSINGNSPMDDDKIIDRVQDKRRTLTDWLMTSKTQQAGLAGVNQHVTLEAARKFLADTAFVGQG